MRRLTATSGFIAATLVLVLTLAGCSRGQPASVTAVLDPAAADLVARTGDYYAEEESLNAAETLLANKCLAAAGFTPPATPATPVSHDEEWRPDPAERSHTGYRLLERTRQTGEMALDPVDEYVRSLPVEQQQQYMLALLGPTTANATVTFSGKRFTYSTHGCLADARTRIYGSPLTATRVFYLPQMYYIELLTKARTEPAYIHAMARWSACMRRSGYHYTNPPDAKTQLLTRYRTDPDTTTTRELEIAVAVTDARCATRVHLGAIIERLLRQRVASLPTAERTALDQVAADRASSVRRAAALTGGH